MSRTYSCSIEVRGYELDAFGHVNHAVYVSYLEHARWQMLTEAGIGFAEFKAWNRWPVIAELHARYRRPTFVGDRLEVRTQIAEHARASFLVHQEIRRGDEVVFSGQVRVAMVDERGRAASLPEGVEKLWN